MAKHFEIVLLYQSIFMILMQLVLLRQVIRYYPRPAPPLPTPSSSSSTSSTTTKSLSDGTPLLPDATSLVVVQEEEEEEGEGRFYHKLFLQRPSWNVYMVGLTVLVVVLSILHVFVATSSNVYVETIGSLALGVEAMLPLPQVVGNFKRKSVQGFR